MMLTLACTLSLLAQSGENPLAGPESFPIAVWLQQPRFARDYQSIGINLYVGLWQGPTEEQLAALKHAGMPVVCDQNGVGLAHRDDPTIVAWMHGDEPDNAQPLPGGAGYGPPIAPARIVADYERMKNDDPSRPVLLNLGQGVANDEWVGRGSDASPDDYPKYVRGADLVSFDVYPVAGLGDAKKLWYVARGVERLRRWTGGAKPVWSCIECTRIDAKGRKATPAQVRSEVWMALIHGARGLIYFVHEFGPHETDHALLDDPEMRGAVAAINRQIRELAPVINAPDVTDGGSVASSDPDVPIALAVKRHEGATYAFAVAMREGPTRGTFTIPGLPPSAHVEVIGEGRTLEATDGRFVDEFAPHAVHLYRVVAP